MCSGTVSSGQCLRQLPLYYSHCYITTYLKQTVEYAFWIRCCFYGTKVGVKLARFHKRSTGIIIILYYWPHQFLFQPLPLHTLKNNKMFRLHIHYTCRHTSGYPVASASWGTAWLVPSQNQVPPLTSLSTLAVTWISLKPESAWFPQGFLCLHNDWLRGGARDAVDTP